MILVMRVMKLLSPIYEARPLQHVRRSFYTRDLMSRLDPPDAAPTHHVSTVKVIADLRRRR